MLQVCEQDMDAADEAVSDLKGVGLLSGKRKRGDVLAHQTVRHSLWEQDSLEAYNELLFGNLDGEVEALQQRKAVYDEERRLSDGSDSCWSCSDSDSGSVSEAQSWRWGMNHLHWRVLWWWPHWEEGWREQPGGWRGRGRGRTS